MREVSGRFETHLRACRKKNADLKELDKASEEISKGSTYEEIELLDDESLQFLQRMMSKLSYTVIDDEVYYRENSFFIKKDNG